MGKRNPDDGHHPSKQFCRYREREGDCDQPKPRRGDFGCKDLHNYRCARRYNLGEIGAWNYYSARHRLGRYARKLYVSIPSTDTAAPNTIIPINLATGTAGTPVAAGNKPYLLSISSDSSYLWVGLDGDSVVQRFLLPGLTKDISIQLPMDSFGDPEQAVSLEAARVNPHTVALVAGPFGTGNGIYVYDDAIQRPGSLPGRLAGGPFVDWIQWGANDSTIYGNQHTTIDARGVATLNVTSSGISLKSYN